MKKSKIIIVTPVYEDVEASIKLFKELSKNRIESEVLNIRIKVNQ